MARITDDNMNELLMITYRLFFTLHGCTQEETVLYPPSIYSLNYKYLYDDDAHEAMMKIDEGRKIHITHCEVELNETPLYLMKRTSIHQFQKKLRFSFLGVL